uniref:proline-rich protein 36 n=1 Tax=Doryrhamphus excisus TaxID=161450 RepID=UPI0025AE82A6|nr:proline-rich protein 36 [Doryrhamphus excisus]
MAGHRGCVNSLWSGSERVRIGERLKATLAGVLELELLRCKQLEMVDAALVDGSADSTIAAEPEQEPELRMADASGTPGSGPEDAEKNAATPRRQQAPSPPCPRNPDNSGSNPGDRAAYTSLGGGSNSRWSTLSWDAPSDLLSPPTPDSGGAVHLDCDSRPSSGFYSVSGSSLSDSCYSVSSETAHTVRPLKLWDQVPTSADNTDSLWSDGALQQPGLKQPHKEPEPLEDSAVSVPGGIEVPGLSFLSNLCSGLNHSLISSLLNLDRDALSSHAPTPQLDPCYCEDLVSRRTKEVYPYPSPLHAVALQSPLFTTQTQERPLSPSPEGNQPDEPTESRGLDSRCPNPKAQTSLTQLEQYISRLANQYHHRINLSIPDLSSVAPPCSVAPRGHSTPGKGHGSTQSLSAFESRSTPSGLTPCTSLLGNSARVSLSTAGKKATRNSINLGSLPSATGEDLNINLHLNLNLNLAPGLNANRGVVDKPKSVNLGGESAAAAPSQASSTPGPALRARPRISTCPTSLSHRSSLEVTSAPGATSALGPAAFSRSLDWSVGPSSEAGAFAFGVGPGSAPVSQRSSLMQEFRSSPKMPEESPMVEEISRLSGLSRAVVVGLMEQGVELDIDCFQADAANEMKKHSKGHMTSRLEKPHDYIRLTELNPQRPVQLSLSVTHSPQSQSSVTPPLSHSSSPIHPYHAAPSHYFSHSHFQQMPCPSDLSSSTASSPASCPPQRAHSPPHPLQASPMGAAPLSVFRRDAPFQSSLPRATTRTSPVEYVGIHPRGGSLRHSGGGSGVDGGWNRVEGDGLYRGKHASHKLIRAATVSSYAKREEHGAAWGEDEKTRLCTKTSSKLKKALEGRLWGKDTLMEREEMDRAEYGYGWTRNIGGSWRGEQRRVKVESPPTFSKKRGKECGEKRSSSVRLSRRALFRSESQGLLVPHNHEEPARQANWVSSFDVGQSAPSAGGDEDARLLRAKEDKHLSSTASLFNLSCSQSLESSCHSISPLSSPSFSPSPPPRLPLQRSRSLRDLGRRVFGSMRSLSLKQKASK